MNHSCQSRSNLFDNPIITRFSTSMEQPQSGQADISNHAFAACMTGNKNPGPGPDRETLNR